MLGFVPQPNLHADSRFWWAAGGQWLMIALRLLANSLASHCPPYD
ncbi:MULTISPECIES: hypothetical protein [unclassified Moorena]|nr:MULTISPECIES: hypothetical protein [unclassified Moorena]